MPTIIGVKFKEKGKTYFFDPKTTQFAVGDGAIVETARGTEYSVVALANTEVDPSEIKGELKPVVRKATEKDAATHRANEEKRLPSIRRAQQLANARKLDMKIVDAEFAFDGGKVVFFFTSDNRIDFRDLVRDLAAEFRMRIELRQIGIRDECKMKGGLGPCGRVCCCNDYLADFARVSIKMAKHQGLSLNPGKISGLCGRLMCCLKYEDDYYAETLKFMPKVNSQITAPDGLATVVSVDMLRQTVVARVSTGEDSSELHEYTLEQLGITPVYSNCCGGCAEADADPEADTDTVPDADIAPDTELE